MQWKMDKTADYYGWKRDMGQNQALVLEYLVSCGCGTVTMTKQFVKWTSVI